MLQVLPPGFVSLAGLGPDKELSFACSQDNFGLSVLTRKALLFLAGVVSLPECQVKLLKAHHLICHVFLEHTNDKWIVVS